MHFILSVIVSFAAQAQTPAGYASWESFAEYFKSATRQYEELNHNRAELERTFSSDLKQYRELTEARDAAKPYSTQSGRTAYDMAQLRARIQDRAVALGKNAEAIAKSEARMQMMVKTARGSTSEVRNFIARTSPAPELEIENNTLLQAAKGPQERQLIDQEGLFAYQRGLSFGKVTFKSAPEARVHQTEKSVELKTLSGRQVKLDFNAGDQVVIRSPEGGLVRGFVAGFTKDGKLVLNEHAPIQIGVKGARLVDLEQAAKIEIYSPNGLVSLSAAKSSTAALKQSAEMQPAYAELARMARLNQWELIGRGGLRAAEASEAAPITGTTLPGVSSGRLPGAR